MFEAPSGATWVTSSGWATIFTPRLRPGIGTRYMDDVRVLKWLLMTAARVAGGLLRSAAAGEAAEEQRHLAERSSSAKPRFVLCLPAARPSNQSSIASPGAEPDVYASGSPMRKCGQGFDKVVQILLEVRFGACL